MYAGASLVVDGVGGIRLCHPCRTGSVLRGWIRIGDHSQGERRRPFYLDVGFFGWISIIGWCGK